MEKSLDLTEQVLAGASLPEGGNMEEQDPEPEEEPDQKSMWSGLKRNLIKNPCGLVSNVHPYHHPILFYVVVSLAVEELNHWTIDESGGDGWRVEDLPREGEWSFPNPSVPKFFMTSFDLCKKSQDIDLKEAGYSAEVMDTYQPDIVVTDWYQSRPDCGCQYELAVKLLSENKKTVQEFVPGPIIMPEGSDVHWRHITHTFSKYGPGVRYISFQHGGKDTQRWAGWYGVRVTNSSVSIEL
ncbi:PREDICTED: F-box only protein 6-like [Nanorana parkeri]|uniref:F-box only protein 6-like n=1 Tax=Nanorana parkeri TaxID=125878 RepID=UPI0008545998|nr:PREDICTED: F-box only protein 6-like [Nanorana parkeri]